MSFVFYKSKTGGKIGIMEWFACEETKSTLISPNKIENLKINGADAVVAGKDNTWNVHWEANNTIYTLISKDIDREDIIRIADWVEQ